MIDAILAPPRNPMSKSTAAISRFFFCCFLIAQNHGFAPKNGAAAAAAAAAAATESSNGTTSTTTTGFSLRLIHRDSVHSVFYPGKLTTVELHHRLRRSSEAHIQYVKNRTLGIDPDAISPMVNHFMYYYYVELVVGARQQVQQRLVLDTGSDITWLQCTPCTRCFPQDLPKYVIDEQYFRYLSYDDPLCLRDRRHLRLPGDRCGYNVRYMDGSRVSGVFGRDALIFEDSNGGQTGVPDVMFGCTTKSNTDWGGSGYVTGVFGMGGGADSMTRQMGEEMGHRFSHCLVPLDSDEFSYLRVGDDAAFQGTAQSTPIVPVPRFPTFYYVNLLDISLNGRRLGIPREVLAVTITGAYGVIVDTGSWYTYLVEPAYHIMRARVIEYFAVRYGEYVERVGGAEYVGGRGVCFRVLYNRRFPPFPAMAFHFEGADLQVPPERAFVTFEEDRVFCSGLMIGDGMTVVGAMQMTNKRFVYDLGRNVLSFADEDCEAFG